MSVDTIVRIPEKALKWLRILRDLGIYLRVSVLQCVAVCCRDPGVSLSVSGGVSFPDRFSYETRSLLTCQSRRNRSNSG